MKENFRRALDFEWRPENDGQGYHVTPGDPGGGTNRGVTQATWGDWARLNSALPRSVADATNQQLAEVLYRKFWCGVQGNALPTAVDAMAFGIDMGTPAQAARCLQRALGVAVDGVIGPVTLAAAQAADPAALCQAMRTEAEAYYRSLTREAEFLRGWDRRMEDRYAMVISWLAVS